MVVALIPARSGSKRIPHKNIKEFCGKPLIGWAIEKALKAECFDDVYVSTDSVEYTAIAAKYNAKVICRPFEYSQDNSPDQEWIDHALFRLNGNGDIGKYEFAILRPTNPFRSIRFIQQAVKLFNDHPEASEVRAIREVNEHPYKMWVSVGETIEPLIPLMAYKYPTTRMLPIFVQGAGIEIRRPDSQGPVIPIFATQIEGIDLDTKEQWDYCESLVKQGKVKLED